MDVCVIRGRLTFQFFYDALCKMVCLYEISHDSIKEENCFSALKIS